MHNSPAIAIVSVSFSIIVPGASPCLYILCETFSYLEVSGRKLWEVLLL